MRHARHVLAFGSAALLAATTFSLGTSQQGAPRPAAEPVPGTEPDPAPTSSEMPWLRVELGQRAASHPVLGSLQMETHEIWKPVCTNAGGSLTTQQLATYVQRHKALSAQLGRSVIVNSGPAGGGTDALNIVFSVSGSIPAGALAAIASVESFLENTFSADSLTVTIPLSFQPMSPGILGGTSSSYGYLTYTDARSLLVGGMDGSDSLQSWLPAGSTCPVRYGSSPKVTNEDRVFFTFANYEANGGTVAGDDANMTFNSNFTWDFDPSNGITGGTYSFQDVLVHETGHALGCTSGGDFRNRDSETLDLFRFQRTDGTQDYNPDTLSEFQTKSRLVAYNSPNDDHNTDLISVEYRMSDGSPYQMSHLREQVPNIGIMDPAFASGETYWPTFLSSADRDLFDSIGYDL
jgi:hypothetical protein